MVAGFRARNAPKPVSMPEFNYEAITSEDGVFAFAVGGTCSVPCTTVTATLTTDSCCLEINGSTIYNVGSGVVTAVVSPLTASGSCGTVIPYVNGEANAAHVADGDPVVVTLQTEDVSCCPCCKVGTPQCAVHHASFSEAIQRRRRAIMKGKKKGVLVVDQDALKEHIQKRNVTSRRSRPTSEPPQASP